MLKLDNQARIVIGKSVVNELGGSHIKLYVTSIDDHSCLMLSASEEPNYYLVGTLKPDAKRRIMIPKKLLVFMGWSTQDQFLLTKHLTKWFLIKL